MGNLLSRELLGWQHNLRAWAMASYTVAGMYKHPFLLVDPKNTKLNTRRLNIMSKETHLWARIKARLAGSLLGEEVRNMRHRHLQAGNMKISEHLSNNTPTLNVPSYFNLQLVTMMSEVRTKIVSVTRFASLTLSCWEEHLHRHPGLTTQARVLL